MLIKQKPPFHQTIEQSEEWERERKEYDEVEQKMVTIQIMRYEIVKKIDLAFLRKIMRKEDQKEFHEISLKIKDLYYELREYQ